MELRLVTAVTIATIHTILLPSQHECRLGMAHQLIQLVVLRVQFQRQVKAVVLEW